MAAANSRAAAPPQGEPAEDETFVLEAIADLIAEAKAGRVTGRTLNRAETALDALELVLTK